MKLPTVKFFGYLFLGTKNINSTVDEECIYEWWVFTLSGSLQTSALSVCGSVNCPEQFLLSHCSAVITDN